ncbi:hypothetical protein [uncultured Methanobrevibacter sp.]|uniref:hypothetical protein n=1 Tax=uncultured Methanobrevibacter sp. TaxID=253161 RepID=UPI0025D6212C|nr:hypothetical protein [uncultured Methanobrevibacter sp.]
MQNNPDLKTYIYGIIFADTYNMLSLNGEGGAVSDVTAVINCTFISCHSMLGGAIAYCDAINCRFINNSAEAVAGAMMKGNATNCAFINNIGFGGSTYEVNAYACVFTDNVEGDRSNNMYDGYAAACYFENNCYGEDVIIIPATIKAPNFKTTYNSGDKLLFDVIADYKKYDDLNVTVDVYSRGRLIGTYQGLSGENNGCLIELDPGKYTATLHADSYTGVSSTNINITVYMGFPIISAPDFYTTVDSDETFFINVKNEDGLPIVDGSVEMVFKGSLANYTAESTSDENGEIRVPIKGFLPGTYHVDIHFLEDEFYEEEYNTSTVFIMYPTKLNIEVGDLIAHQEGNATFELYYLDNETLNPCPNETLKIFIIDGEGNILLSDVISLNSEGKATVPITPITNANISFLGEFLGNPNENKYNVTFNITEAIVEDMGIIIDVKAEDILINQTARITVNLTDINENPVINGKVLLTFDDGTEGVEIPIDGSATFFEVEFGNTSLAKDVNVTAIYLPKNKSGYITSNSSYIFKVKRIGTALHVENITVPYLSTENYSISLMDEFGMPLSGLNLYLSLNEDIFAMPTDNYGKVMFRIGDFMPNAYLGTVSFGGNDDYLPSDANFKIVIERLKTDLIIEADNLFAHDECIAKIHLESDHSALAHQEVFVTIADELGNVLLDSEIFETDEMGVINVPFTPIISGHIYITGRYDGKDIFAPNVTSSDVFVGSIGV